MSVSGIATPKGTTNKSKIRKKIENIGKVIMSVTIRYLAKSSFLAPRPQLIDKNGESTFFVHGLI